MKFKIEKLNAYNSEDPTSKKEILNLFGEIIGQIKGNQIYSKPLLGFAKQLGKYLNNPSNLSEPIKRSLVTELKEKLRSLNIENLDDLIGGKKNE